MNRARFCRCRSSIWSGRTTVFPARFQPVGIYLRPARPRVRNRFMRTPVFLSISDQVAAHLRSEIARGRWRGELPGRNALAQELGVNAKTVEEALRLLERAEVLVSRGSGLRRRINPEQGGGTRKLRIGWLMDERETGHQPD